MSRFDVSPWGVSLRRVPERSYVSDLASSLDLATVVDAYPLNRVPTIFSERSGIITFCLLNWNEGPPQAFRVIYKMDRKRELPIKCKTQQVGLAHVLSEKKA